jgi:hypothetical protein
MRNLQQHATRKRRDYLKPISLNDSVWLYVEDKSLCIVVSGTFSTQHYSVTWKRLDQLRKQMEEDKS